jgi:uncharacterized protein (TIGR02145 family)
LSTEVYIVMKTKNRFWFCSLIVVGLVLILFNSCKKEKDYPCIDGDGNQYDIVTIGSQVWMAENMKTKKYLNGDLIGTTTPATLDISNESIPKYQWSYNNDESNVATYGRLYTWYAVTDNRKLCPEGWHVPTAVEWVALSDFLGGEDVAGGKLKEVGNVHWISSEYGGATNESGFTGLPGGLHSYNGLFSGIGSVGIWWSSWESRTYLGVAFGLNYLYPDAKIEGEEKSKGYSVRCIKD